MSVRITGIDKTDRALQDEVTRILRRAAINLWNGITKKTPVDTGRLRNAWHPSSPVQTYSFGSRLTINNPLPYAAVVEFGLYTGLGPKTVANAGGIFSSQAPRGMARITVEEVSNWLDMTSRKLVKV